MDIMELGAIGELVGGVAVVVTLVYLAVQLRQGNQLEKAESIRAAARDRSIALLQPLEPNLARRGFNEFQALSKDDQTLVHNWFTAYFLVGQAEFGLEQLGLMDRALFEPHERLMASMIRTPGLAHWWRDVSRVMDPEFVRRIDEVASRDRDQVAFHEALPWLLLDDPTVEA